MSLVKIKREPHTYGEWVKAEGDPPHPRRLMVEFRYIAGKCLRAEAYYDSAMHGRRADGGFRVAHTMREFTPEEQDGGPEFCIITAYWEAEAMLR